VAQVSLNERCVSQPFQSERLFADLLDFPPLFARREVAFELLNGWQPLVTGELNNNPTALNPK
jgi:hypothetical protein